MAEGVVLSSYIPLGWLTGWSKLGVLLGVLAGIWSLDKLSNEKFITIERKKDNMLRGASGEIQVSNGLTKLPDGFCVINDLATSNGNIEHVVVGPTGVFVLDTKAWRGVVRSDGHGDLLLNEKPTEKPYLRQFLGRMMGVREKVSTLVPGMLARFNAVFVFTAAQVEAKWGTTGHWNCITDDQLYSYIAENDFGKKLKPEIVSQIAQAFLGLA